MYSILLHGRRKTKLSFMLNDWEPAIHARNLIFLQMILESRSLLQGCGYADEIDGIIREMDGVGIEGKGPMTNGSKNVNRGPSTEADAELAFALRIGSIFR